jgi:di/tripeptidase
VSPLGPEEDDVGQVAEYARDAIRRSGLTVRERPIRGGTDGCRLSIMALPVLTHTHDSAIITHP